MKTVAKRTSRPMETDGGAADASSTDRMVAVAGWGAVSPAGWGMAPLRQAMNGNQAVPTTPLPRPGSNRPLAIRKVPSPSPRPAFLAHPRLRRSSPISQFAVGAALEALGTDISLFQKEGRRLGLIFCVMAGCVAYSRRFYDELLHEPATASPMLFPETVFNAPASHLAALLGSQAISYTLVGDAATFLSGLSLAGNWLLQGKLDGCLVVGAEECDWVVSNAFFFFEHSLILAEGAGCLYLKPDAPGACAWLKRITEPKTYARQRSRLEAVSSVLKDLPPGGVDEVLCDGIQNNPRLGPIETEVWKDWPGKRVSPKAVLGEGLMAGSAWQCCLACDVLVRERAPAATVSVVGANEQASGARFVLSATKD